MDTQTIQDLLSQVSAINRKYKEKAEITDENFNLFRILRIEAEEVITHSRLLCELFNPKGTHGKGSRFLEIFLKKQNESLYGNEIFMEKLNRFNVEQYDVITEFHISFKNEAETEGGRIDILFRDNSNNQIVIENKIYAGDQPKQLIRYNNAFPDAPIFYLTLELDEKKPSVDSKGNLKEGEIYKRISYKEDILDWLKDCRKETENHPIIRESITQYINLIKFLTGQDMNEIEKKEILQQIIAKPEYIDAADKLLNNIKWDQIKAEIINKLCEDIKRIAQKLNLEVKIQDNLGKDDTSFWFFKNGWKHCICFCFDSDYEDIVVSIENINNDDKCDEERLKNLLKSYKVEDKTDDEETIWARKFKDWEDISWDEVKEKAPLKIEEYCKNILNKIEQIND